jgi:transposase
MKNKRKKSKPLRTIHTNAAGIDIGAKEIYIAIPEEGCEKSVRRFDCFTDDLHEAAKWMKEHNIDSIAMESTGVYWIPIYQLFESYGFKQYLVNARHVKNVPGRKTDVKDSQWLQYLHSVGLLDSSYIPEDRVVVIRSFLRHRDSLIKAASSHVQRMQKSLTQMNIQLHNVISDITGETGLKIITSILSGNHDPVKLSMLKNKKIKASKKKIIKSLTGNYRDEHLFTLRQSLESYQFCHQQINRCDEEIEKRLKEFESASNTDKDNPQSSSTLGPKQRKAGNSPSFDLQGHMYRIFGTDVTRVDGISAVTAQVLFSVVGANLDEFPTSKHFCSWIALSPQNKISGGRILSSKTKRTNNKAAQAFRLSALSLSRSKSYLGHFYRKMKARNGAPKAITATAHKLARIFYKLVKEKLDYDESVFIKEQKRYQIQKIQYLKKQAKTLGLQLVKADLVQSVT